MYSLCYILYMHSIYYVPCIRSVYYATCPHSKSRLPVSTVHVLSPLRALCGHNVPYLHNKNVQLLALSAQGHPNCTVSEWRPLSAQCATQRHWLCESQSQTRLQFTCWHKASVTEPRYRFKYPHPPTHPDMPCKITALRTMNLWMLLAVVVATSPKPVPESLCLTEAGKSPMVYF